MILTGQVCHCCMHNLATHLCLTSNTYHCSKCVKMFIAIGCKIQKIEEEISANPKGQEN